MLTKTEYMTKKGGLVYKSTGSWYKVKHEGQWYECRIRGKFRQDDLRSTNPIAVGDVVDFLVNDKDDLGYISHIHDRRNYIIRRSTNLSKRSQVLAANIDRAFLVITLAEPRSELRFIDRFLVTAQAYKIPVNIIFNKTDLYDSETMLDMQAMASLYQGIGYECWAASATHGDGIEALRQVLRDKVCVFSGNSGVGKSTLINAIDANLDLKVGEISEAHFKGKHTTTFAEMFDIQSGGSLIDTPGVKSFGMLDMQREEIAHYFPEMFALLDNCKFYNCTHTHEPGCAVKKAVDEHLISPTRYDSYLQILEGDDDEKYRSAGY